MTRTDRLPFFATTNARLLPVMQVKWKSWVTGYVLALATWGSCWPLLTLLQIKGLKYQKWRVKQMMFDLDPSIKKEKGADYFKMDEDLDEEWIKKHQAFLIEEQRQKITKKFEKENEKRAAEGQEELKPEVLEERLKVLKDMEKKFEKENKTGKVEVEGKNPTIEKLENNILKLEQRIETMTLQAQDKEDNKEVALGTSKIVRLILSIIRHNVPLLIAD